MEHALTAMGLDTETGWQVLGIALCGGLMIGISAATGIAEAPWSRRRWRQPLRTALASLVIAGMLAVMVVLGMLMIAGAAAPVIVALGLGVLAGPPLAQALERLPGSKSFGLSMLLIAECGIVTAANTYLL